MKGVLQYAVYTLNYKGVLLWQDCSMPPIMSHLTAQQILELEHTPLPMSKFECHTQSVERGVAATSKAVKRRRSEKGKLMQALSTEAACSKISKVITHKDFDYGHCN